MESTGSERSPFERAWTRRVRLGAILSFLGINLAAIVFGPIDRPGEAILLALLTLLLGVFIGLARGRNQRRFIPYVGTGPRISQSMGGEDPVLYRSFDTTETPFELVEPAIAPVALLALTRAPFIGATIGARIAIPDSWRREWAGVWLFQTHDSHGRPVFLDEGSLAGMLDFSGAKGTSVGLDGVLSDLARLKVLFSRTGEEVATGPRREGE